MGHGGSLDFQAPRRENAAFAGRGQRAKRAVRALAAGFGRSASSPGSRLPTMFDHIDQLKRQYTDKYVVVVGSRPELRRFEGLTGTVRTVNMNGRALVEFDAYNNIGWYDIGLDFLKVVDKPLPKPEPAEKPAKAAGESKSAPAAKPAPATKPAAAAKPAAAPAAGGKLSTADILAAARAKKATDGGGPAASAPAPAAKPAAPAAKPATGAPASGGKLSTAEILAAARGKQAAAAAPAPAAKAAPAAKPAAAPEPVAEPVPEPEPVASAPAAVAPKAAAGGGSLAALLALPTAEKIAWCRQHDASGS
jgi:hypothetical protein